MDDLISRKMALDALGERPLVWNEWADEYCIGQRNQYDADKSAIEGVTSARLEYDRLHPKIDKNFSSCLDCIHSEDSEYICILRKCVHAIYELKECYIDKRKETE